MWRRACEAIGGWNDSNEFEENGLTEVFRRE
jgi:hypothetical protein